MPNWVPDFWKQIDSLLGPGSGTVIYWYFQYIVLALAGAGALAAAIALLIDWVRLAGGANEKSKQAIKERRVNIIHGLGYLLIGMIFIQVFWNFLFPEIFKWVRGSGT
ncbi:MAG: hypothetical protein LBT17_00990 [Mycoplasmataceae bacterium]|nr:hypothetical protein [Mycoplasmataceae bacterium]